MLEILMLERNTFIIGAITDGLEYWLSYFPSICKAFSLPIHGFFFGGDRVAQKPGGQELTTKEVAEVNCLNFVSSMHWKSPAWNEVPDVSVEVASEEVVAAEISWALLTWSGSLLEVAGLKAPTSK